jgi:hypothetical protein
MTDSLLWQDDPEGFKDALRIGVENCSTLEKLRAYYRTWKVEIGFHLDNEEIDKIFQERAKQLKGKYGTWR